MLDETDFKKEARHIAEFADYLDLTGMRSVATCPYVYKPFSKRRHVTLPSHCSLSESLFATQDAMQFIHHIHGAYPIAAHMIPTQ